MRKLMMPIKPTSRRRGREPGADLRLSVGIFGSGVGRRLPFVHQQVKRIQPQGVFISAIEMALFSPFAERSRVSAPPLNSFMVQTGSLCRQAFEQAAPSRPEAVITRVHFCACRGWIDFR